jgi:translation initiation factor 5B
MNKENNSDGNQEIRQPIVTIAGHVDHGKTSILDKIRETSIAKKEAGSITQRISFTKFPSENIKKSCYLIDKEGIKLRIPGFLFVDTPGHQAFTNLRKRGGSLADLAILVIDINEGIMPQTQEVLQILRKNKTPFIIALNKIDRISGWRRQDEDIKKDIEKQSVRTKQEFDEKLYKLIGALQGHKFNSDLFYNIKDFTKKVAIVPTSAETEEGLPELLMVLCGLSQKYLSGELKLGEKARGVIFEIKKEKAMNYIEAILYDGKLRKEDKIAIATFDKPIISNIRVLEEVCPLCDKFEGAEEAKAATGIRLQLKKTEDILPGMPFMVYKNNKEEIEKEFEKETKLETDKEGIVVKADSLGSLEALITLLKENKINIVRAGIGDISKEDVITARTNLENQPLNACILGFNVKLDKEAKSLSKNIKIISEEVVYKLIEDFEKWREEKQKEIEKGRLMELSPVFKLKILPKYVFRNSNPAIFGVRVGGGTLKPGEVIDESNKEIGKIKAIQEENQTIEEAGEGKEIAVSIPGLTFDRQLKETKFLYSNLTQQQYRKFKKNRDLLSSNEKSVLKEIAEIKRRENPTWGV